MAPAMAPVIDLPGLYDRMGGAILRHMGSNPPPDITLLLAGWSRGDRGALDRLTPLVHAELRRIAQRHLRRESPGHTLQPTALVHEAYLKLAGREDGFEFQNRVHFFSVCAQVMRHILVDHARARMPGKRGGGPIRVTLHEPAA